ncbi:hypothetical protein [uncultured Clostridium sp.]|uniref:hypothetical protein n=1 Tax=uncultured Clostridium sp. TaxID=59620 RepID=UPI002583C80D|nr:hypothetical protein [uncultured Clostridium sp.]
MKKNFVSIILSLAMSISFSISAYAEPKYSNESVELQTVNIKAEIPDGFPYTVYVLYQKENDKNISGYIMLNTENNFTTSDQIPANAKIKDIKVVGSKNDDVKNYSTIYSGDLDNLKVSVMRIDGKPEPVLNDSDLNTNIESDNDNTKTEDSKMNNTETNIDDTEEKKINDKLEKLDKAKDDEEINNILEGKDSKKKSINNLLLDGAVIGILGIIFLVIKNKKSKGEM